MKLLDLLRKPPSSGRVSKEAAAESELSKKLQHDVEVSVEGEGFISVRITKQDGTDIELLQAVAPDVVKKVLNSTFVGSAVITDITEGEKSLWLTVSME